MIDVRLVEERLSIPADLRFGLVKRSSAVVSVNINSNVVELLAKATDSLRILVPFNAQ